jgi:hypothetical protein
VVERAPSRQTETVLATAAGNVEAGPSEVAVYMETVASDKVVGLIRRAQTPLFLPLDENMGPSDESYIDEAEGSSSEEGSKEGSEDEDENVKEDEDVEEANEMDIDQTLRD